MLDFVSVDAAHAHIYPNLRALPTEVVRLTDALGRTTAAAVTSPGPLPPFSNAAMDGVALRAADVPDVPTTLPLAFEVSIATPEQSLPTGTCARITTGQPLPPGADAVVPVEHTNTKETLAGVQVTHEVTEGQYVRPAGENVAAGDRVIGSGQVLMPAAVSLLAAVGAAEVTVRQQPQVAILVTGDEIVPHTQTPPPGAIRDSNGPDLQGRVQMAGGQAYVVHAGDRRPALRHALASLRSADVLVVSGGMSVGRDDLVREVLTEMGTTWHFHRIRQRPGKPMSFGHWGDVPVFGLPGNPVSSAVCFEVYVRPALAQMLGRQTIHPPRHTATLTTPLPVMNGLHYFARGVATVSEEGRLQVRSTGAQGSGLSRSMWEANCLIHVEEARTDPQMGEQVLIQWLPGAPL
ncbi:MAG: molybdopterin molybdenumtransferase MoeA [Bacteroidetes bacterium]|jgi:molybdopterin molybdotransferase|nr:molybdopterin molybdenumtransferase MoeA [Bacteroidota bacterium]